MNFQHYQRSAGQFAVYMDTDRIIYPAIGVSNEAGELLGKIKKWIRGDDGTGPMHEDWVDSVAAEMGDVLWYLSALATDLGIDLGDVAMRNIFKLDARSRINAIKGDGDER